MANNNYYLNAQANNLFSTISEYGYNPVSLDIVSFLAILSSILVITTSNQVVSVLFLISLFINVSIYLLLLEISFIGLTYIIVYVGAVTILFLFVIMLLNIKLSEVIKDNSTLPYGAVLGIIFLYPLFWVVSQSSYTENNYIYADTSKIFNYINYYIINLFGENLNNNNNIEGSNLNYNYEHLYNQDNLGLTISSIDDKIDKVTTILWDNTLFSYTQISTIGHIMYSSYIIWFFVVSLILLLAMVGAISLTLRSNNNSIPQ